jgi:hypothetical protein
MTTVNRLTDIDQKKAKELPWLACPVPAIN